MSTSPVKSRRHRHLIPLLALSAAAGWYFTGDAIVESIDRSRVRHFHYQPDKTKLSSGTRQQGPDFLYLANGACVRIGKDVTCYARSMGHHRLFGFRNGYSYVNINGHTYWKPKGECGTTLHVNLELTSPHDVSTVTENQIVTALRKDGFSELR